jgi:small nuclear ribonucleoprotein (snRNP)-like protein
MNYPKHRNSKKKRTARINRNQNTWQPLETGSPETESAYLKSLVDSRASVTVTLKNGESFRGRIRYYDLHCFSVGLLSGKRKIFLRKENVSYITEE